MSQHTPGPWNFTYLSGGMVGVAAKGRGLIVNVTASKEAITGGMTAEEEEANARLIAKAPELLELLRMVIDGQRPSIGSLRSLLQEIEGQP